MLSINIDFRHLDQTTMMIAGGAAIGLLLLIVLWLKSRSGSFGMLTRSHMLQHIKQFDTLMKNYELHVEKIEAEIKRMNTKLDAEADKHGDGKYAEIFDHIKDLSAKIEIDLFDVDVVHSKRLYFVQRMHAIDDMIHST